VLNPLVVVTDEARFICHAQLLAKGSALFLKTFQVEASQCGQQAMCPLPKALPWVCR